MNFEDRVLNDFDKKDLLIRFAKSKGLSEEDVTEFIDSLKISPYAIIAHTKNLNTNDVNSDELSSYLKGIVDNLCEIHSIFEGEHLHIEGVVNWILTDLENIVEVENGHDIEIDYYLKNNYNYDEDIRITDVDLYSDIQKAINYILRNNIGYIKIVEEKEF